MEPQGLVNTVLLAMLAIGAVTGLIKGLIRQVVELIGVIGSFFIAILFSGWLAELLRARFGAPYSPALVASFVAIFVAGMIGFHFLALLIQKVVRMTFLGWVDRLCGALLGIVVGMLVTSLLITVSLELPIPGRARSAIEQSKVSLFLRPMAPWLFDVVFDHDGGIDYRSIFKRGGA